MSFSPFASVGTPLFSLVLTTSTDASSGVIQRLLLMSIKCLMNTSSSNYPLDPKKFSHAEFYVIWFQVKTPLHSFEGVRNSDFVVF